MKMTDIDMQASFEEWYSQEKKTMPPFNEFVEEALHSFSKLAWMEGAKKMASLIEAVVTQPKDTLV